MKLVNMLGGLLVLCALVGCKSTDELSVTVSGEGVVTSSPEGISCGSSGGTCKFNFEENAQVTLLADADEGHVFTGWEGVCSGVGECVLVANGAQRLSATFVMDVGDIEPPSSPVGMINAVGVDELQVQWADSIDQITAPENILYEVYVSEQREGLVDPLNQSQQLPGNQHLEASITDLEPGTEYFVAVVAVDESRNKSIPAVFSTITPEQTPAVRDDVVVYLTDEQGWENPVYSAAESTYVYTLDGGMSLPEVDSFIAYPVTPDSYMLTKVVSLTSGTGAQVAAAAADGQVTVLARDASVFEISDDVSFSGSIAIAQDHGIITAGQSSEGDSILPEPDDSCDRIITDELIFNPNLRAPSVFEYNVDASTFNLCSSHLQDQEGNCPESDRNTVQWKGDIFTSVTTGLKVSAQDCFYRHFTEQYAQDEFYLVPRSWLKKVERAAGPAGRKAIKFISQIKFGYELNTDYVISASADGEVDTKATMSLQFDEFAFGVASMLRDNQVIANISEPVAAFSMDSNVYGDIDFVAYVVPNITAKIGVLGQVDASWRGDYRIQLTGSTRARTPDPLFPLDVYFSRYTLYADMACFDSVSVDLGLFGALPILDLVETEITNRRHANCNQRSIFAIQPFAVRLGQSRLESRPSGTVVVTPYYFLHAPLNTLEWETLEYGIMLLNGEMIPYPVEYTDPVFERVDPSTGLNEYIFEMTRPLRVTDPQDIIDSGGGQKFWMRVNTSIGRAYMYLTDWQYPQ